jgi:hypothetical protein
VNQISLEYGSRTTQWVYGDPYKNNCPDYDRMEELVARAREISVVGGPQPEEWYEIYEELQQIVAENAICYPLWDEPRVSVYNNYVKGYKETKNHYCPELWKAWKEIPEDEREELGILMPSPGEYTVKYSLLLPTIPGMVVFGLTAVLPLYASELFEKTKRPNRHDNN